MQTPVLRRPCARAPSPGWFATPALQDPPARSREVYGEPVSNGEARLDGAAFGCAVVQGADQCEIRLEGEIDLAARPALDEALYTAVGVDGVGDVALDLRAVTFADSSAVAWLLSADRLIRGRGRQLTIVACSAPVRDLLRLTGIEGRIAMPRLDAVGPRPDDDGG
jgi:anti-anti-sigma factor